MLGRKLVQERWTPMPVSVNLLGTGDISDTLVAVSVKLASIRKIIIIHGQWKKVVCNIPLGLFHLREHKIWMMSTVTTLLIKFQLKMKRFLGFLISIRQRQLYNPIAFICDEIQWPNLMLWLEFPDIVFAVWWNRIRLSVINFFVFLLLFSFLVYLFLVLTLSLSSGETGLDSAQ